MEAQAAWFPGAAREPMKIRYTIDIRNNDGELVAWAWWLNNLLSPILICIIIFFLIFYLFIAIVSEDGAFAHDAIVNAWEDFTVIWPGLLFFIISCIYDAINR